MDITDNTSGLFRPASGTTERYDLDNLQSDLDHLAHLIDAIADITMGIPQDPESEIARVNAFAWIARNMIDDLNEKVEDHHLEIETTWANRKGGAE